MRSYGSFRGTEHRLFTPGMPSTDYHRLSTGSASYSPGIDNPIPAGAGHAPDSPYPAMPGSDTYDPIWAEYEDGLPDYEQPEPGHGFVSRSAAPLRPPPPVHFESPQPPEYGSPADQLLAAWCINRAWEELPDPGETEPVPTNIGAVAQPAHTGGNLYGYGSAEPLQSAREASAVLEDTLDRRVEETLDIGRPYLDESFEATHPYAGDPRFRSPLEGIIEQEMQRFEDPYRPTDPPAMPEMTSPGLGFTGPEASLPW
ncbi:MAG: hypothetical protein ABIG44_11680 [Planctomycetota bacterium]